MKTRGLVMEVDGNMVIVLTPDGRFLRLPRQGKVNVGEEYAYYSVISRAWLVAAAMLLLAVSATLLPLFNPPLPAAYVTVDINPSLELAVSQDQKVLSAHGLNDQGELLLLRLRLKGYNLAQAMEIILDAARGKNYLSHEGAFIMLSAVPAASGGADPALLAQTAARAAREYLNTYASPVAVTVVTGQVSLREEAAALGLSTGKYAVYLEAQDEGLPLSVEDLREKGIGRALLDLDVHPKEVLGRVERVDLIDLSRKIKEKRTKREGGPPFRPGDDNQSENPAPVDTSVSDAVYDIRPDASHVPVGPLVPGNRPSPEKVPDRARKIFDVTR